MYCFFSRSVRTVSTYWFVRLFKKILISSVAVLYENISKNGIILLDDYSHIKGATLAVDEFLKNKKLKIYKVSKNGRPYFIQKK